MDLFSHLLAVRGEYEKDMGETREHILCTLLQASDQNAAAWNYFIGNYIFSLPNNVNQIPHNY